MPSRASTALWRFNGKCRQYRENSTCASSRGPARPRAIECEGAGGCASVSRRGPRRTPGRRQEPAGLALYIGKLPFYDAPSRLWNDVIDRAPRLES
jgi:hypothetical protein